MRILSLHCRGNCSVSRRRFSRVLWPTVWSVFRCLVEHYRNIFRNSSAVIPLMAGKRHRQDRSAEYRSRWLTHIFYIIIVLSRSLDRSLDRGGSCIASTNFRRESEFVARISLTVADGSIRLVATCVRARGLGKHFLQNCNADIARSEDFLPSCSRAARYVLRAYIRTKIRYSWHTTYRPGTVTVASGEQLDSRD